MMVHCKHCATQTPHLEYPCEFSHPTSMYGLEKGFNTHDNIEKTYLVCDVCGADQADRYGRTLIGPVPIISRIVKHLGVNEMYKIKVNDQMLKMAATRYRDLILENTDKSSAMDRVCQYIQSNQKEK